MKVGGRFLARLAPVILLLLAGSAVGVQALSGNVRVWDTSVLGLAPGGSVEDPAGLTGHFTGQPTIATVFTQGANPGGPSGVAYWGPETSTFSFFGKTVGFPTSIDLNRAGPVMPGGPFGASFGPGDVWIGGQQNQPLYVHIHGTYAFRTYGTDNAVDPPSGRVWGVKVDQSTGLVFVAQPDEGRISRLDPPTGLVTMWDLRTACGGVSCGAPTYVTLDGAGRPYATMAYSDGLLRVDAGSDGTLGTPDDTLAFWRVPSLDGTPSFRTPGSMVELENPNGVTTDADGNVWFAESSSNEIGRLSAGPDGVLGTADDLICEYTTSGLTNPQQITTTGSGRQLQVYVTEGDGNAVSILTQAEADLAGPPARVCTTVAPLTFPAVLRAVVTRMFDEQVMPISVVIMPTIFSVPGTGTGASGTVLTPSGEPVPPIVRFSPMPNPLVSTFGMPTGDAGNGFPSGLTGVYAGNRAAGAYLKGNKVFEFVNPYLVAP